MADILDPLANDQEPIRTLTLTLCDHVCCPTVTITESEVIIKDDFGGQVRLTRQELALLRQADI